MSTVTRTQIVESIRSLGVRAGDLILAHSSYKRFGDGCVAGGPTTVAQALVDVVSPGGSIFVPTFNYGNDPYDPATAPSYDGIVTEFFRKLPGAVRSLHPTHALAGIGPAAGEILAGHDRVHAFARGSPVWRLWERDAWVLLIGVGHFANSMAHVAEELLEMPYLDRWRTARVVRGDGTVEEVEVRRPGCSDAWEGVLGGALRARGAIVAERRVGEARVQLMRARDVVDVTAELLRRDATALLCARAACEACARAREMLG
jgi:aminoglycoside 3-N-acetyltransferase